MTIDDREVMAACLVLVFLLIWIGAVLGMNFSPDALPS